MSWSVTFIGTPDKIVKALQENSEKLSGMSKEEYDAALPNLVNLVKMNFNRDNPMSTTKIHANGSAYSDSSGLAFSNCNVNIEYLGIVL